MAGRSKTWWGAEFVRALESCMDPGRLQRGRSYARPSRQVYCDVHLLGVRTSHRFAFEIPQIAPLLSAGALDTADAQRRCQVRDPRSLPPAHVLRRAPVTSY